MKSSTKRRGAVQPLLILTVGLLTTLFACSTPKVSLSPGSNTAAPSDYDGVFWKWTREMRIIRVNGGENMLTARATYMSHEFRMAYVERNAADSRLSTEEREAKRDEQLTALDTHHEFYVTVQSGIYKSYELEPEKGIWSIKLQNDNGRQVVPIAVEKVRKPTFSDTTYFNFDKKHRTAYRITFPILDDDDLPILSDDVKSFSVLFSSALGQGDVRWETSGSPGS